MLMNGKYPCHEFHRSFALVLQDNAEIQDQLEKARRDKRAAESELEAVNVTL